MQKATVSDITSVEKISEQVLRHPSEMKATMKNLNAHIAQKYPTYGLELVRGNGYFYFANNGPVYFEPDSIQVCYLHQVDFARWCTFIDFSIDEAIKQMEVRKNEQI